MAAGAPEWLPRLRHDFKEEILSAKKKVITALFLPSIMCSVVVVVTVTVTVAVVASGCGITPEDQVSAGRADVAAWRSAPV